MKPMIILITAVGIIAGCKAKEKLSIASDTGLPASIKESIDDIFRENRQLTNPGYAIGILRDTEVLYTNGYGAANLEYNIPITAESAFDIASVSKQFTAACIALLIMEGKLSLETPASKFVPALKKYTDTIRVKHLVYNCSGITDYHRLPRPGGRSWNTFHYFTVDDCLAVSLALDTLAFRPGEKWDYCNVNFMLLTKIVEAVGGQSFSEFAKEKLFTPLGMINTFINDDITVPVKNRVMPYNKRSKENTDNYNSSGVQVKPQGDWIQHPRTSPHYGGSGVVTTVDDLLLWSRNFFTRQFGGGAFYEQMHHKETFLHDRNNQALGLYEGRYKERTYFAWDGGDWGISSQLIRFPAQRIAIVVLSNYGEGEAWRKANAIADILIGHGLL